MIDKLTPRVWSSDQDERLTKPTMYVDAQNIILDTDESGDAGVIKTIKGNQPVTNNTGIFWDEDNMDFLGSVRDPERGRTYFFVVTNVSGDGTAEDPVGQHAILFYQDSTNSIELLIKGQAVLKFDKDHPISANVINGFFRDSSELNTLLYFTDGLNEPRKLNVDKVSEYDALDTNTKKRQHLEVIKPSPYKPIEVSAGQDPALGVSDFSERSTFQFAFQYIYKDGEVSALSPISKSVLAGRLPDNDYPNHLILTMNHTEFRSNIYGLSNAVPDASLNADVKLVRVLYREEKGVEQSAFRILDEYDPSVGIKRSINGSEVTIAPAGGNTYIFLNRGFNQVLPSEQEDLPFQAVPRRATSQAIINSRLIYGNYVEGFNNVDSPDGVDGPSGDPLDAFEIDVNYTDISEVAFTTIPLTGHITTPTDPSSGSIQFDVTNVPENVKNGDTFYIDLRGSGDIITKRVFGTPENPSIALFGEGIPIPLFSFAGLFVQGDFDIPVLTADAPLQAVVTFNGDYTKAESVAAINDYLEDFQVFKEHTFTVTTQDGVTAQDQDFYGGSASSLLDNATVEFKIGYNVTPTITESNSDPSGNTWELDFDITLPRLISIFDITDPTPSQPDGVPLINSSGVFIDSGPYSSSNMTQMTINNTDSDEYYRSLKFSKSETINGFTNGSNHSFAISYVDRRGRFGNAQEIGSVYVEPIGSQARKSGSSFKNAPASITISPGADIRPPAWAVGYNILYAGPDDIEDSIDLFIDDATKVVKSTKFFPGLTPDTVFVNIKTFVDTLRQDGIEFNAIYNVEEGDILRVISKREVVNNSSYQAGNGAGNGMLSGGADSEHDINDTHFYCDFGDTAGYDGNPFDFRILSIVEISENTAVEDYPFGLAPDASIIPGVYLELEVDPGKRGWGRDYIFTLGEFSGVDDNALVQLGDSGDFKFPFNRLSWAEYVAPKVRGFKTAAANEGVDFENDDINPHILHRELYVDNSFAVDDEDKRKYLQSPLLHWDKGVRAQIIKPKRRTSGKVYSEIAHFVTLQQKGVQYQTHSHGTDVTTQNGYAYGRRLSTVNVPDFKNTTKNVPVVPGALGGQPIGSNGSFDEDELEIKVVGNPFAVRPQNDSINMTVESFMAFYGSRIKANHIGRPNVVSKTAKEEKRRYSLIHSGFQGSETPNLALQDFKSTNFKDLDVNHGPINAIHESGQFITVLQSSKASRVPISRSIIATAGGDTNLAVSNTVFGPERSFGGDYGCDTNLRSSISIDGSIYFIDKGRRSIIRIAGDGFNPISDGLISRQIERSFKNNSSSTDSTSFSMGYDKDYGYLLVTFRSDDGSGETYGWDHKNNRWVSRYSFTPKGYIEHENHVISIKSSQGSIAHVHDNYDNPGNFYGSQENTTLDLVSTGKNPSMVKVYNAVGLESSNATNIDISNTDQSVSIPASKLVEKERSYYSSIPFDGSHLTKISAIGPPDIHAIDFSDQDLFNQQDQLLSEKAVVRPVGVVNFAENENGRLVFDTNFFTDPIGPESGDIIVLFYGGMWVPAYTPYLAKIGSVDTSFLLQYSGGFLSGTKIATNLNVGAFIASYLSYGAQSNVLPLWSDDNVFSGAQIGYARVNAGSFNDSATTTHPTIDNQITIGGKKVRDHFANVKLSSSGDFELYSVNLDVDDSKIHM
tara:strand:- start:1056 stop:6035 length:4980 start_codon:yes stop_codon:yes gene_type:complete